MWPFDCVKRQRYPPLEQLGPGKIDFCQEFPKTVQSNFKILTCVFNRVQLRLRQSQKFESQRQFNACTGKKEMKGP